MSANFPTGNRRAPSSPSFPLTPSRSVIGRICPSSVCTRGGHVRGRRISRISPGPTTAARTGTAHPPAGTTVVGRSISCGPWSGTTATSTSSPSAFDRTNPGGMILRRVPEPRILEPGAYEEWGWDRGTGWAWGQPATPILPGPVGEMCLRRIDGTWVLAYFDPAAYAIVTRTAERDRRTLVGTDRADRRAATGERRTARGRRSTVDSSIRRPHWASCICLCRNGTRRPVTLIASCSSRLGWTPGSPPQSHPTSSDSVHRPSPSSSTPREWNWLRVLR